MLEEFIYALKTKFGFGLKSRNWKHWFAYLDLKTCKECRRMHGKIYAKNEKIRYKPPLHMYCRCIIQPMNAVISGECSLEGKNGADWWLMNHNTLPGYYIFIEDLRLAGWNYGEEPKSYMPGKMVFGGIHKNKEGRLPAKEGRVWFEADLNYYSGKRNGHRLVWSNDGLFFVTYDHYQTFMEVVGG